MCAEVVFEDTEAEVIVGSQPSTYDAATAVDEMQADPIGGRPSPYQNSVVFNECGSNRVEARLALAPPTPPGMRVRTGRFAQHSRTRR